MSARTALSLVTGIEPGVGGVRALVARALELRAGAAAHQFRGARVGAVFLAPSLRTRTSLEAACAIVGAHPIALSPGVDAWAWELRDGVVMDGAFAEHAKDAIPVLASYVDVLAVRAFAKLVDRADDLADPVLTAFSRLSSAPVLNLESARWHPLQGLADAATWVARLGEPRGRRLVVRWAPHVKPLPQAVPNQVAAMGSLLGMDVVVAHPEGFDLEPDVMALPGVSVSHDPSLAGADVVYAKSWGGSSFYGRREAEDALRASLVGRWRVDAVPEGAGLMHCLPVRRNLVVADAALDGPSSWVQEQAANRLWTAIAVLERQLGGGGWPSG